MDVVRAPAERVWRLVVWPKEFARWSDTTVVEAPARAGELRAGDRLVLGAGVGHLMRVILRVQEADRPHRLALHIQLPFGVTNSEVIQITPVSADACRVTFN
jgi:uncharacterized protein YndB with AHSA1/START domain